MATIYEHDDASPSERVDRGIDIPSKLEDLNIVDSYTQVVKPSTASQQTSRSHDPQNNLKRSDPFQFGSRYLQDNDNVFEFNAWDHVETDETYNEYAEMQYSKQREAPVSDFDKGKLLFGFLFRTTVFPPAS
jgi:hypothetical protein